MLLTTYSETKCFKDFGTYAVHGNNDNVTNLSLNCVFRVCMTYTIHEILMAQLYSMVQLFSGMCGIFKNILSHKSLLLMVKYFFRYFQNRVFT